MRIKNVTSSPSQTPETVTNPALGLHGRDPADVLDAGRRGQEVWRAHPPAGATARPRGPAAPGTQQQDGTGTGARGQETYFDVRPKLGERLASNLAPRAMFAHRAPGNARTLPCSQPGALTRAHRGALSTGEDRLWSARHRQPTRDSQVPADAPTAERASEGA